jgi:DNA-directed RNA polymerase I, II, and III subunit RPABC2
VRAPIQPQRSFTNKPSDGGNIDFDQEEEPEILDNDQDDAGGDDPEAHDPEDNIVDSGDASAAATGKGKEKNTVESEKLKKVKNHERTTTPYMTKYERARVLGTRALQIRCVRDSAGDTEMGG